jgi:hypothetical protein
MRLSDFSCIGCAGGSEPGWARDGHGRPGQAVRRMLSSTWAAPGRLKGRTMEKTGPTSLFSAPNMAIVLIDDHPEASARAAPSSGIGRVLLKNMLPVSAGSGSPNHEYWLGALPLPPFSRRAAQKSRLASIPK